MSKLRYRDTDYIYLSARMRARLGMSDAILPEKIAAAASYEEALSILGTDDSDAYLDQRLSAAFELVREFAPDDSFVSLFAYPYDCQNLKIALKYSLLGLEASPPMIPCANVAREAVLEAAKTRDFSAFSPSIAACAEVGLREFLKSGDIQRLDFMLDRGALLDMLSAAEEFGCAYLLDLIRMRIDLYHVLSFCRMRTLELHESAFLDLYCEGGTIPVQFFADHADESIEQVLRALCRDRFYEAALSPLLEAKRITVSALQDALDLAYMARVQTAASYTFGAEPVVAYLLTEEKRVKDIRRILAEKRVLA